MKKEEKLITFQEIIQRLDTFWANRGCVIGQPYGLEVGAGTANPNTFLRSLGPEPFNVAYVEPSRRPADGRYGKNPYRLQHYFQYQVILKPAPVNNQELYFEMLNALGIDTTKHDIRFVEDNWESPAIGAWGLGWEVWLDGMEISQYTYFQQVSGVSLEVPTLEITLGLERLTMYIQGVDDYREIMWNNEIKYGDLFEKHEYWQSIHNYETANVDDLRKIYDLTEKQVENQLKVGNYWVAYDYLLKISHIFNILDSRGVVSVTDRTGKFKMMGHFSKRIAELYLAERAEMKYPLAKVVKPVEYVLSKEKPFQEVSVTKSNKLVLELYFEELPAEFLEGWMGNYYQGLDIGGLLKDRGFNFENLELYWGPRRVVLIVEKCSLKGVIQEEIVGPLYDIAFQNGKINDVGKGFLKKYGAINQDIVMIKRGGNSFLGVRIVQEMPLERIVGIIINKLFGIAPAWKTMKWYANQGSSFVRPLRNILCFLGDKKIDVEFENSKSSEYTFCTRHFGKNIIGISSATNYLQTMKKLGIVIDQTYRGGIIKNAIEENSGKYFYSPNTEKLVQTNTFLVEYPNVKFMELNEKYVKLPIELITEVLEKKQKYIIRILKSNPRHIEYAVIANKKDPTEVIFKGNTKVLQGRLDDALFYWKKDLQGPKLKELRSDLENVVFHPQIGSYKEKVLRIEKLVNKILKHTHVKVSKNSLKESLELIKNDKATHMVGEFASLEGIIGAYYARRDGYPQKTATLLKEYYLPTSENSELPSTVEGVILSLADKLEHIISFTKIGLLPEGSNDPYEVRKNVYNLIRLFRDCNFDVNLYEILKFELNEKDYKKLLEFFNNRIYLIMKESTHLEKLARGVAYSSNGSVCKKFQNLKELQCLIKGKSDEDKIFDTFKRVQNILKDSKFFKINPKLLSTESEKTLFEFFKSFEKKHFQGKDLIKLSVLLEKFFEETMVNVKEEKIKVNRISLLMELNKVLNSVWKI